MSDIVLEAGGARLAVATLGAEARSWQVGGRELLWPGDPAIWAGVSPILFPVVGWLRDGVRVAGKPYALEKHGFARRKTFVVDRRSADSVRLVLRDDEETRAVYPFAFRFAVEYAISGGEWRLVLEAANTGSEPMPYACGTHPGVVVSPGAATRFSAPERPLVPRLAPGGLMSRDMRELPLQQGTQLPVNDELYASDALCFLDCASHSLRLEQADGSAIEMARGDFLHMALWRRPPGPYLCLEAWTGYSDPVGFAGDLFEKPSMRVLAPGETARHAMAYRFHPA